MLVGVLACVSALAVASCGGSDRLTRAEFVKQAEALCTKARRSVERKPTSGASGLVEKVMTYERMKTNALRDLKPPVELEGAYRQYMTVQVKRQRFYAKYAAAARSNEKLPPSANVQAAELQTADTEAAHALHLRVCAE